MSQNVLKENDPLSELYDVASALRFLEDAFEGHDESNTQIRAGGAAYVTRLMGIRLGDIAGELWEMEIPACRMPGTALGTDVPADQASSATAQGSPK